MYIVGFDSYGKHLCACCAQVCGDFPHTQQQLGVPQFSSAATASGPTRPPHTSMCFWAPTLRTSDPELPVCSRCPPLWSRTLPTFPMSALSSLVIIILSVQSVHSKTAAISESGCDASRLGTVIFTVRLVISVKAGCAASDAGSWRAVMLCMRLSL